MDKKNNNFLVSIFCITYNQAPYISQAIEGFLSQKTNFDFEIVIGEDCSKDNTKKILEDYNIKFPGRFRLILHEKNIGSMPNFISTLKACNGKYIALCDGDDYWTDPNKLQKQVDFMQNNSDISFCCHNAETFFVNTGLVESFNKSLKTGYYTTNHLLLKRWFIPTASLLIRREFIPNPLPNWFSKIYSGDYALELLLSITGNFYYLNEKKSVYRINALNSMSVSENDPIKYLNRLLFLYKNFKNSYSQKIGFGIYFAITRARLNLIKYTIYKMFR
ncbi:MAG: glycosyltransferase [bacterium]